MPHTLSIALDRIGCPVGSPLEPRGIYRVKSHNISRGNPMEGILHGSPWGLLESHGIPSDLYCRGLPNGEVPWDAVEVPWDVTETHGTSHKNYE